MTVGTTPPCHPPILTNTTRLLLNIWYTLIQRTEIRSGRESTLMAPTSLLPLERFFPVTTVTIQKPTFCSPSTKNVILVRTLKRYTPSQHRMSQPSQTEHNTIKYN